MIIQFFMQVRLGDHEAVRTQSERAQSAQTKYSQRASTVRLEGAQPSDGRSGAEQEKWGEMKRVYRGHCLL